MDDKPRKGTNEEAARWAVRLDSGALSAEEQREFDAWLDAAPHHRGALIRARAAWAGLDRVGALAGKSTAGHAGPVETAGARTNTNRRFLLAASIAAVALVGGASFFALTLTRDVYESAVGEVRRVTLADGSGLVLNTASRAVVRYDDTVREVRLERGEALFQVHKDTERPFIVRTGNVTVQAVGTAFAVRIDDHAVNVIVTEGVVEIARKGPSGSTEEQHEPRRVTANQQAVVRSARPVAVEAVEPSIAARRLAWREGMLAFDGEPLSEAVSEINRHSRRQIVIDDQALGGEPVVGIFRVGDVEGFARAAATALDADVQIEGEVIHLARSTPP